MRVTSALTLLSVLLLSFALCGMCEKPISGAPLGVGIRPIGPQYISSAIVWGLLVGLMLLFVLFIGTGCIMGIQRPVRMTTVPLQLAKEY